MTIGEIMRQHIQAPVRPLREIEPAVSEGLQRVCLKMLEKKPENRFQSASELVAVLAALPCDRQAEVSLCRRVRGLPVEDEDKAVTKKLEPVSAPLESRNQHVQAHTRKQGSGRLRFETRTGR